jgi:C1A family cysteine protease
MTENNTIKHKFGWIPDLPDFRDYSVNIIYKPVDETQKITQLPASVDLRSMCSKIEDQGQLGSCTSNAIVGNLEFLEIKDKIAAFADLSRLFVYYNERVIEHSINYDNGASLRDGIKTIAAQGICTEKLWPYDISKFRNRPNEVCYKDALNHRATAYYRIDNLTQMRICLADGFPFVFGFSVFESFESPEVANTGIVPMPAMTEQLLGGHAVCAVGYNMDKKIFTNSIGSGLIRNSWGTNWGEAGYFWMPLEYLINRNLSNDFWSIRTMKGL